MLVIRLGLKALAGRAEQSFAGLDGFGTTVLPRALALANPTFSCTSFGAPSGTLLVDNNLISGNLAVRLVLPADLWAIRSTMPSQFTSKRLL